MTDNQNPTSSSSPLPSSIGVCWMDDDGKITLRLRAELPNGLVGHAMAEYPPQHREYAKVLKHVGPLKRKRCPAPTLTGQVGILV